MSKAKQFREFSHADNCVLNGAVLRDDGAQLHYARNARLLGQRRVYRTGLPDETRRALEGADAVLLGAVGLPKYDGQPGDRRPEKGLLDLRKALGVYANLRPVRAIPVLANTSPLGPGPAGTRPPGAVSPGPPPGPGATGTGSS